MSNFLAIATVTATLRQGLLDIIGTDVPGATVTTQRPDIATTTSGNVNIYLYQVTPNTAWRNSDLPTRNSDGELVQRSQVALNLKYLLTFYGDENKLEPQRLLGSVVRTLHSRPVITRQMINNAIMNAGDGFEFLANSNLANDVELVKFTPISMSTEELSKIWSVFFQTSYNISIAYEAAVVLIESEDVEKKALPVHERSLYVRTFNQPLIEHVMSKEGENKPIVANSKIVIIGKKLLGDVTTIKVSGIEIVPEKTADTQISLQLPPGLQVGVHGVQVVHQMLIGMPPTPHAGMESNVMAFVLQPTITAAVSNTADIEVNFSSVVGKTQNVVLLLNEFNPAPERRARSYSFKVPPRTEDASSITVSINDVGSGDYLVRVQVDGAESPLEMDNEQSSPTFNQYVSPKVTIL